MHGILRLSEGLGTLALLRVYGFANSLEVHNEKKKSESNSNEKTPTSISVQVKRTVSDDSGAVKITPSNGGDVLNAISNQLADTTAQSTTVASDSV